MIISLHTKVTNTNEENSEENNNTVRSSFKQENILENSFVSIIVSKI